MTRRAGQGKGLTMYMVEYKDKSKSRAYKKGSSKNAPCCSSFFREVDALAAMKKLESEGYIVTVKEYK